MGKFPKYSEVPVKGRLKTCLSLVKKEDLKGKVLVDVGCSSGWLLSKLKRDKLKRAVGVDSYEEAVKFAKQYLSFAEFYVSEASSLPLKNESADFVTMFDVIEHVPKREEPKTLKETMRVLKKGGKLFLSTPNFHPATNLLDPAWYLGHRHYTPEKIKALIEDAGFKRVELETRGGRWSIIYMLWFYITKWILRKPNPRDKYLEEKDDKDHSKPGFFTIFLTAEKF